MLAEWITSLTTPCRPAWRRLGAVHETIATRARYGRCRAAWAPHIEATRAAILDAIRDLPNRRKAAVLGSGLLLDVPLADLAGAFDSVVLVDLVHTRAVRRQVRALANVQLIDADIGGVLDALAAGEIPDPVPPAPLPGADADFIVSCNVAGQLPVLPAAWLRARGTSEEAIARLARALIDAHLAALAALPGSVLLVTETKHELVDGGRTAETFDPLYGARLGSIDATWTWELAPRPEIHARVDLRATVVATRRPLA